jgi:hypothetical protein
MGRGRKRHRRHSAAPVVDEDLARRIASQSPEFPVAEGPQLPPNGAPPPPELVYVDPQDVAEIWPLAESLFASELEQTDWTSEQLIFACSNAMANLWMICEGDDAIAALVTVPTPKQRCMVAVCSGNNLWEYLPVRHQLYAWAKEQGMKEVVFYGRPALAKLMPECKRGGVILRKEL